METGHLLDAVNPPEEGGAVNKELLRGKGSRISCSPGDLETVLSFCACGLVGTILENLDRKNFDLEMFAEQICRLLTGEIPLHFTDQA